MAVNDYKYDRTKNYNGTNQPALIISGLAIVIGAVIIYLYVLNGVFGRYDSKELIPNFEVLKSSIFDDKKEVGILYSNYTQNMMPKGNTWVRDNIKTWEKFLSNTNLSYEIINDETIELGKHFNYDLIILPGSKSLSDKEIIEIKKFIDAGGSIFATSGTASYSDDGKWRGWDFLSQVFGVKFTKEISSDSVSKVHTLRGGLPLTANIPTGYPLKIATWDRPMAVQVLDPRTTQISYWYNYKKDKGLVRENIAKSAGIVNGTYNNGRFVWLGFEINSVIGVQKDFVNFEKFFNNCINWLTYGPIAYIKDWPNGYDAAAIIASNISGNENQIDSLIEILNSENVKSDFFIEPSELTQKSLLEKLSRAGKVYPVLKLNYFKNDSLNFNKYNQKGIRIKKIKNKFESFEKSRLFGTFLKSSITNSSNNLLSGSGYNFFITDSLLDRSVPVVFSAKKDNIVCLMKNSRDDNYVIKKLGLKNTDFQFYTYQEDIDRTLFNGGLYIFNIHQQMQMKPENIKVIKKVLRDIKKKNIWLTTAEEAAEWYSNRANIEIHLDRRGKRRVAFNVTNFGDKIVKDLIINVDLNDKASNVDVKEEIIGTRAADFKFYSDKRIVIFHIDALKAGESRTYYIDYDHVNT